jgi:signal transduction histidine kinase
MRRGFRVPMFVIAAALLGLIGVLATLQYKWVGQISGAERERMTSTLNARAAAYGLDFDREITRAYLLFQLDLLAPEQNAAGSFVTRYDRWQATARFPRMIKDVYLASRPASPAGAPAIQRFNPATRFLEPAEWPAVLSDVRGRFAQIPAPSGGTAPNGSTFVFRAAMPTVWPAVPAIVVTAPMVMVSHVDAREDARVPPMRVAEPRHTILLLDDDYIRSEMLPALAQLHFQKTGDTFDYQLAVVQGAGRAPIYRSTAAFSPEPDAAADAKVDLFQVRVKDFEPMAAEVSRFATFTALASGPAHRTKTVIREMVAAPSGNVTISGPMSIVVQSGAGTATEQRVERLAGGPAIGRMSVAMTPASSTWRLLVKHPSGSLEDAVNAARRRNLIVSSSILGILGLSVGFLVVSTRRAQELARQQLEFVATVSHELRTPLAVIRSAADNLADGVVGDQARVRQYGDLVRREGVRLSDLVEQILEYAGLQSGQRALTPKPVEIGALLGDVVSAAAPAAQAAGVSIDLSIGDGLPAAAGDEAALRRVFQNLVGNAIKYGAAGQWVGVTAAAKGGGLEVRVSDRGMGIPAAEHAKIFDPFYRAPDVVAAQIHGAGLGLSLVKRIVDAHGGRVTLESAPGQGSTFIVSLPAAAGAPAADASGIEQPTPQPS